MVETLNSQVLINEATNANPNPQTLKPFSLVCKCANEQTISIQRSAPVPIFGARPLLVLKTGADRWEFAHLQICTLRSFNPNTQ